MLNTLYFAALIVAFLWTLLDWRRGLYFAVLFDVARDPVRKMLDDQPVYITVAAASLWLAIFLGASRAMGKQLFAPLRYYNSFRLAMNFMLVALVPPALIAVLSYEGGWKVAGIGFASYTLPIMGVIVGVHLFERSEDLWRLLGFYCICNSVALLGSLFEFLKYDWPALGGINMTWLRYQSNYTVDLITGYYRSPDVMGLHAATVSMFSTMLAMQPRSRNRWFWFAVIIWSFFCLVLSGRRKMIGMLMVFAVVYMGLKIRRLGLGRMIPVVVLVVVAISSVLTTMKESKTTQDYAAYANTTLTDGGERLQENVIGGVVVSLRQSGAFGNGLGTATQGRYYVEALKGAKTWQEDGVSRIFAEMGVFGACFMILAACCLAYSGYLAWIYVPIFSPHHEIQNGLIAVVCANAASFVVSHQAYSGDPCSLLFVALLYGVHLSCPGQVQQVLSDFLASEENSAGDREEEDEAETEHSDDSNIDLEGAVHAK